MNRSIKFLYTFIVCLANVVSFAQAGQQMKLMVMLYNEKKVPRCAEFIMCLEKNLQNRVIDEIHVLYDVSNDDKDNFLFNYLKTRPVRITLVNERVSYGDCFKIANHCYPHNSVILANADIFFNKTLELLENYDLTDKFLTLNRWDVQADGTLRIRRDNAQDVWIFSTPLRKFVNDAIKMGVNGCDPEIAYYAQKSGLNLENPCLSVQSCHLHLSKIRNFKLRDRPYTKELEKPIPHTKIAK